VTTMTIQRTTRRTQRRRVPARRPAPGPAPVPVISPDAVTVTGWRLIPKACPCDWTPWYARGRGTWALVTISPHCTIHATEGTRP
jgi:hypothetical protein